MTRADPPLHRDGGGPPSQNDSYGQSIGRSLLPVALVSQLMPRLIHPFAKALPARNRKVDAYANPQLILTRPTGLGTGVSSTESPDEVVAHNSCVLKWCRNSKDLRRFTKKNVQHPDLQAVFAELGKATTIFSVPLPSIFELRREINVICRTCRAVERQV
jgi:hypothetical protein